MLIRTASRVWRAIEEPRVRRVMWSMLYSVVAAGGLMALVRPPGSIEGAIGPALTTVWAVLLLAGGLLGAVFHLTRWWVIERAAIYLCGSGAAIYLVTVLWLHVTEPGQRITQAAFIAAYLMALAIRFYDIRTLNADPLRSPCPLIDDDL